MLFKIELGILVDIWKYVLIQGIFKITLDGDEFVDTENSQPVNYNDVGVFISPDDDSADAIIKDFVYESIKPGKIWMSITLSFINQFHPRH